MGAQGYLKETTQNWDFPGIKVSSPINLAASSDESGIHLARVTKTELLRP